MAIPGMSPREERALMNYKPPAAALAACLLSKESKIIFALALITLIIKRKVIIGKTKEAAFHTVLNIQDTIPKVWRWIRGPNKTEN